MGINRARLTLPHHLTGPHPFLPTTPDDNAGGGGAPGSGAPAGGEAPPPGNDDTSPPGPDLAAEVEKWRAMARKHEDRAKVNAAAAEELEQLRQQQMTAEERARTEAYEGGRAAERSAMSERLIAAEFRAEAAAQGRDIAAVTGLLEDLNVARFLTDAGDVDLDRVRQRVAALPTVNQTPPPPETRHGNPGQGGGTPPPPPPGSLGESAARERFGLPAQQRTA